ncbi:MAG: 4Fe-4S binding protein [Vicinamibacterales bacterium]
MRLALRVWLLLALVAVAPTSAAQDMSAPVPPAGQAGAAEPGPAADADRNPADGTLADEPSAGDTAAGGTTTGAAPAADSLDGGTPVDEALADDADALADEADPWGFDDEEELEPTLAELAQRQLPDMLLFAAFTTLAMVSFFRKSERLKVVTLVAAVLYMGIYKSQLISIVNVYSFLSLNLPVFQYSMAWYLFAGFTLASTILWGRLYCGRFCAFGALTQLMDRIVPARFRVDVPKSVERHASRVKFGLLAVTLAYFFATDDISIYRYVEPFWMFTFQASTMLWVALGALLVATVFVRNVYCRFLCPVGAFLGLVSAPLTVFRIKRWSECNTCRICQKTCEWGAIQGPKIIRTECVRCDDCEVLYNNTQKCPHWLIIQRKADVMARRSAVPVVPVGR